jgi:hypothetical protein
MPWADEKREWRKNSVNLRLNSQLKLLAPFPEWTITYLKSGNRFQWQHIAHDSSAIAS